ncbi:MAG: hypothetical protein B5M53_06870 [Candidatus Cloacimonas sp. 4484_209]|nr:MAG: hypothetical protein B5M53_06870 [Candidatus Cloacimonas sp. 4484_209]
MAQRSVKDILVKMRSLSQLMVDIGFAAIMEDDAELAYEAAKIKVELRELSYKLRIESLMVSRLAQNSESEIPQIANLLQIGVATKEISDGIDDLIEIVMRDVGVHPIIHLAYRREVRTMKLTVAENSPLDGKRLRDVEIDEATGFNVMAVRRGEEWLTEPDGNTKISANDVLIVKGKDVSIKKVQEYVKANKKNKK